MARVWVKLNDKGLRKKEARIRKELDRAGAQTATDLAIKGKWYAKSIAPKWSGKTSDYIIMRSSPATKSATIIAKNSTANRKDGFNLVRWLHESPSAQGHLRKGTAKFMFAMRDYLNDIKGNVAKGEFNKIKIR